MTARRQFADPFGFRCREAPGRFDAGASAGGRRRFGSKGGAAAPEPDKNIGRAAMAQAQTGRQWLGFAREQFAVANVRQAKLDETTLKIGAQQIEAQDRAMLASQQDRDRYTSTFLPMQDRFIREANEYDSPERQAQVAAEARADVEGAIASQKGSDARAAAAMGINPTSGRYAGIDRASSLTGALAAAGAENNARKMVQDRGMALRADAINMGNGLPAQSAAAAGLGLNAGNSVLAGQQGANSQFLASTDIMNQGYRGQMAGYAGQASALNQQYSGQLAAWQANQQAESSGISGLFQGIGSIAGAAITLSSRHAKHKAKLVAEGAALEAIKGLPIQSWNYKPGLGADGGKGRHIGPYAQDFTAATGSGNGTVLHLADAIGVTMAAVKDLDAKLERRLAA